MSASNCKICFRTPFSRRACHPLHTSASDSSLHLQCALPSGTVTEMVEFMLSVLSCGYDPARKNAVLFFGGAIHFRALLAIFDSCSGLARILDCLQTVLMLLHGQQDLKTEKQVHLTSLLDA